MSLLPPSTSPEEYQRLLHKIDALCPYPVPVQTRERWLQSVLKTDPNRVDWHIDRVFRHSGSEIGVLVAAREGSPDPFNRSDREIVAGMLMVYTPTPPTPVMRRGIDLEPIILNMVMSGEWLKDQGWDPQTVRIEKVETPAVMAWEHKGVPYSGNPDVVVRVTPDGERPLVIVIDAKSPGETSENPYDAYAIQVDHYRWGLEKHGIHTDLSAVAQLDLRAWALHVTINDPMSYEKNIRRIADAASFYHEHYLSQGILPEWTAREDMALSEDDPRRVPIEEQSMRFVSAKLLADSFKKVAEDAQKSMLDLLEGEALPKSLELRGPLLKASSSLKEDEDRLAELFVKVTGQAELPQKKVTEETTDWNLVKSVLTAKGVPDTAYMKQSTRFLMPTGKSALAKAFGVLKTSASARSNPMLETVEGMVLDMEDRLSMNAAEATEATGRPEEVHTDQPGQPEHGTPETDVAVPARSRDLAPC